MKALFLLIACFGLVSSAHAGVDAVPQSAAEAWQPPEADVLQVKLFAYLHFQAQGSPTFQLKRMTWFNNAADAELPGIVVSVDYLAPQPGSGSRCGTMILRRQDNGSFSLVRDSPKPAGKASGCQP